MENSHIVFKTNGGDVEAPRDKILLIHAKNVVHIIGSQIKFTLIPEEFEKLKAKLRSPSVLLETQNEEPVEEPQELTEG